MTLIKIPFRSFAEVRGVYRLGARFELQDGRQVKYVAYYPDEQVHVLETADGKRLRYLDNGSWYTFPVEHAEKIVYSLVEDKGGIFPVGLAERMDALEKEVLTLRTRVASLEEQSPSCKPKDT